MSNFVKSLITLSLLSLLLGGGLARADAIAVITHLSTAQESITNEELSHIYLGKTKSFPSGAAAAPINQADKSKIRQRFEEEVLGMNKRKLKKYWSKLMFTGKGKPPKAMDGDAELLNYIASTPGALGYISGDALTDKVKVLMIIP